MAARPPKGRVSLLCLSSRGTLAQGLALTPDDAWAVHSLAHVYEMRAEVDKSLSFFERTEKDWQVKPQLAD